MILNRMLLNLFKKKVFVTFFYRKISNYNHKNKKGTASNYEKNDTALTQII